MRTVVALGLVAGCAVAPSASHAPIVAVGGDSPLVAMFVHVGADEAVAPDRLAAASWVRTRFRFASGDGEAGATVGLLGIADRDVAHAAQLAGVSEADVRADDEASLRAGAALLR